MCRPYWDVSHIDRPARQSVNRMLISQLKRFLFAKLCFHLDSMFNLAFISHFYAVVIHFIQTFQTQDAMQQG